MKLESEEFPEKTEALLMLEDGLIVVSTITVLSTVSDVNYAWIGPPTVVGVACEQKRVCPALWGDSDPRVDPDDGLCFDLHLQLFLCHQVRLQDRCWTSTKTGLTNGFGFSRCVWVVCSRARHTVIPTSVLSACKLKRTSVPTAQLLLRAASRLQLPRLRAASLCCFYFFAGLNEFGSCLQI